MNGMKPIPPPHIAGATEFERFDNAVRKVLSVPKDAAMKPKVRSPKHRKPPKKAR